MTATKVLFVNENIGGHATVHHHLRRVVDARADLDAVFLDVPPPGSLRRVVGAAVPGLARLDLDLQPLRAQLALSAWVRRRLAPLVAEADVVHVYTQNAALLSVGMLSRCPVVMTMDSTNARNAYRLPYRRATRFTPLTVAATKPFERRAFGTADALVANSQWIADSLVDDYGIDRGDIDVIPFGITAPPLDGATRGPSRPRIVFLGRQFERKGGLLLLDVYRRHLAGRADLLLITGDDVDVPPDVEVVSDLTPGSGRLWELLARSSVLAFPSEIDQAPNAVLEAMAAGLPVVAAASGAVPEMVIDGTTGLLYPPGDAEGLARALCRVVDDGALRADLGAAGRHRFDEVYDTGRAVDRLVEVFARVLGHAVGAR